MSGRADSAVQWLGYTTGRWLSPVEVDRTRPVEEKWIWTLTVLDRTLWLQRPVGLTGASGQYLAVKI